MTLAAFIEANPFIALAGVAVSSGGVVAGIMAYLGADASQRKLDLAAAQHQGALNAAQAEAAALKAELAASDDRFARIERDVGGKPAPLDVSKLTISTEAALALPKKFASFANGLFFLDQAPRPGWTQRTMLESEMTRENIVIDSAYLPPPVPDVPVHVWKHDERFEFAAAMRVAEDDVQPVTFVFQPGIVLQYVDPATADLITARAAGATAGAAPAVPPTSLPAPAADASAAQVATSLEQLLRGRLPLILMVNSVTQAISLEALAPGVRVTVSTVRQVGNVLYTRIELYLPTAGVPGALTVVQETFYVGVADGGYFIKTQLPTRTGTSAHGAYIQQWLSGLRLPAVPPKIYS